VKPAAPIAPAIAPAPPVVVAPPAAVPRIVRPSQTSEDYDDVANADDQAPESYDPLHQQKNAGKYD
jgi:hypothetical protein